jgi:hypothetical protein
VDARIFEVNQRENPEKFPTEDPNLDISASMTSVIKF